MKKKKKEREERPESAKLHNKAINKNIDEVETEKKKKKKRADHLPAVSPHLIPNHKMYTCDRRSV